MKVVLTGPECSGKTTLATQLAEHFGVSIAPEPARGHLQPEQVYQPSDLLQLTAVQRRLEVKEPVRLQVFDTDLQTIYIWWQEKFGPAPEVLRRAYAEYSSQFDRRYLLCRPDIPWKYDPLRENPDDRDRLYELYRNDLSARGLAFGLIEGQADQRFKCAVDFIQRQGG